MLDPILCRFPDAGLDADTIAAAERSRDGLINDTWLLGPHRVLQRLHPIFGPEVNLDIQALTPELRAAGLPVPRLLLADSGQPYVEIDADTGPRDLVGVWRLMTRLPGRTVHCVENVTQARAAGRTFARFHGALRDTSHEFASRRAGVHDTPRHMAHLRATLTSHTGHRLYDQVAPVAEALLERWATFGELPELPARVGHGDPKISNLLFDADDQVTGLVDLDTMARTRLDDELGDALRSWCSTTDESAPAPDFALPVFDAAMAGYLAEAADWLTREEVASFAAGTERICLELSSRFAADALTESYFGWDPARAATRGEHNLMRARNQLTLARAVAAHRDALTERLLGLHAAHARGQAVLA